MAFGTSSSETIVLPLSTVEAMTQMRALDKVTKEYGATATKVYVDILHLKEKLTKADENDKDAINAGIKIKKDAYDAEIAKIKEVLSEKGKMVAKQNELISKYNEQIEVENRRRNQFSRQSSMFAGDISETDKQLQHYGDSMDRNMRTESSAATGPSALDEFKKRMQLRREEAAQLQATATTLEKVKQLEAADNASVTILSEKEKRLGKLNLEYRQVAISLEENKKQQFDVARADNLTVAQKEKVIAVLSRESVALRNRANVLEQDGAATEKAVGRTRMMGQQMTYAIQDFVSAGGFAGGKNALAQGFRGAANNFEMMAMTMSANMSPLKALGIGVLPTIVLASLDMANNMHKAAKETEEAASAAREYNSALKQIVDSNQAVTRSEHDKQEAQADVSYRAAREKARVAVAESQAAGSYAKKILPVLRAKIKEDDQKGNLYPWERLIILKRIEGFEEDERKLGIGQQQLREVDAAEAKRKQRSKLERRDAMAGGKAERTKLIAARIRAGENKEAIRADIRRGTAGLDPDVAKAYEDTAIEEAEEEAANEDIKAKIAKADPRKRAALVIEDLENRKRRAARKFGDIHKPNARARREHRLEDNELDKQIDAAREKKQADEKAMQDNPKAMLKDLQEMFRGFMDIVANKNPPAPPPAQPVPARMPNLGGFSPIAGLQMMGWNQ